MIKYSIIVPCYKAEASLPATLDSILRSTLREIEVICINDCSPDNTLAVLKRYQRKDERIRIVDFEVNQGVAAARNAGLDLAQGEIIGFVDSDDTIDECLLADVYAHMRHCRSDINLVSFKFHKPDKVVYFKDLARFIRKYGSSVQRMDTVDKLTMLDDYCWRLAIRRSYWEKNKVYFPVGIKGSEDQCFWKPQELAAERVSFLDTYGYNYYWNPVSLTKAEMSSFETVRGIDELMRRLPIEFHLPLMEKCYARIHAFGMKNRKLKNQLKRSYVKRVYAKAAEAGARGYEMPSYGYRMGYVCKVLKDGDKKKVSLFGIPVFKVKYSESKRRYYVLGIPVFSKKI